MINRHFAVLLEKIVISFVKKDVKGFFHIIEEGFKQNRRQRSSLLLGEQDFFNSLPRYL